MINDTAFDRQISNKLLEWEKKKLSERKSSGKLTASILGWALQWQILHHLQIPQPENDEYTLRKFLRGNQIEEWVVSMIENIGETQKEVEYRGVTGHIDFTITHGSTIPFLDGQLIPHEIKSVTNMDFRRIIRSKEAKPQHHLQAGLYALALGSNYYAIDYIASDDLRLETYIYETKNIKSEIDKIIDEYNKTLASGAVPIFTPRYDWQKNPKYATYPDWMQLTEKQIIEKLKEFGK